LQRAEKDAGDAASWIDAMMATLQSDAVGSNVDEVENLIKAVKLEEASKDGCVAAPFGVIYSKCSCGIATPFRYHFLSPLR